LGTNLLRIGEKYFMKIIIESILNYNFEETNFVSTFEIYSFASKLAWV
jgi:hypothetical protein